MNKKDIDFLQELEIKIFKLKNISIITENDYYYYYYYDIVEKIKKEYIKRRKRTKKLVAEKRKKDKNYDRSKNKKGE